MFVFRAHHFEIGVKQNYTPYKTQTMSDVVCAVQSCLQTNQTCPAWNKPDVYTPHGIWRPMLHSQEGAESSRKRHPKQISAFRHFSSDVRKFGNVPASDQRGHQCCLPATVSSTSRRHSLPVLHFFITPINNKVSSKKEGYLTQLEDQDTNGERKSSPGNSSAESQQ